MPKTQSLKVSISGVRGVIGETLTPELVCRFAEAFGAYVGRGPVIVGRDTRPSGLMAQQAVHPCRDSFTAMGIILEAVASRKLTLSALMNELPRYYTVKRKYPMSSRDSWRLLRLLRRYDWDNDTYHRRDSHRLARQMGSYPSL